MRLLPVTQQTSARSIEPEAVQIDSNTGFEALVREHATAMYRVSLAIVRDPALAEDVVQEAVLRAWDNRSTFRGEGSMRGWLLRITHNAAVSELRRRREVPSDPGTLPLRPVAGPDYRAVWVSELEAVGAALDTLDELSRSILALRVSEDMSYEQIAQTLGITLGQVKIRLLRARRALAAATGRGAS